MLMSAAMLLTGCVYDAEEPDAAPDAGEQVGTVFVNFRLTKANGGYSRAGGLPVDPLPETPGTSREDAVETVDLLMFTVGADGKAALSHVYSLGEQAVGQIFSNDGYSLPIDVRDGEKIRICAAVNMAEYMRQSLFDDNGITASLHYDINNYQELMNAIVPGSSGFQRLLQEGGSGVIPMSGQFTTDGGDTDMTISITADGKGSSETNPLVIEAKLKRMVAKMHVLVTPDGAGDGYLESTDPKDNKTRIGWIREGDVRYTPNGVSKETFLFEQLRMTATGGYIGVDPTMSLPDYYLGDGQLNEQRWGADFICHTGYDLHDDNLNSCMEVAELLNGNKLDATLDGSDGDRYTRGMYCTENYFDVPDKDSEYDRFFAGYGQLPMVTHLSVAARFTPRVILVETDFKTLIDDFVSLYRKNKNDFWNKYGDGSEYQEGIVARTGLFTDADAEYWTGISDNFNNLPVQKGCLEFTALDEKMAQFVINVSLREKKVWSARRNEYRGGMYADGTFFVYDRPTGDTGNSYLYLTAGAVASATGDNHDIKSHAEAHPGGWGYYYTYLTNTDAGSPVSYTGSQVYRNTYYLVTVGNFGSPGGRYTSPQYIKVNTDRIGWSYAGYGDINLK